MALNQTLERHSLVTSIKNHPLVAYFGLTYLLTWLCWFALVIFLPSAFQNHGTAAGGSHPSLLIFLFPLGNIVPSVVGIILTRIVGGRGSVRALFGQVVRWRVNPGWYGIALFLAPAVTAGAVALSVALGVSTPALSIATIASGLVGVILAPLGEELGWRGFALPRLQAQHSAFGASIVLGLLWGIWHLPVWIAGTTASPTLLIPALALQVLVITAFAVLITWVFNNAGGSLLLTMLFHASITATSYYPFPQQALTPGGWEQTLLYLGRRARGRRGLRPRPLDASARLRPHPGGRRWARGGRSSIPVRWARFIGGEPGELQGQRGHAGGRPPAGVAHELD